MSKNMKKYGQMCTNVSGKKQDGAGKELSIETQLKNLFAGSRGVAWGSVRGRFQPKIA